MEDLKEKTENIISHAEDFAQTFYKLTVLKLTQKIVNVSSAIIVTVALCTSGLFFVLFGGLALSWWLGDIVRSRAAGFLLVAAFFLIITLIIIYYRKKIIFPFIRDKIIRKIYE